MWWSRTAACRLRALTLFSLQHWVLLWLRLQPVSFWMDLLCGVLFWFVCVILPYRGLNLYAITHHWALHSDLLLVFWFSLRVSLNFWGCPWTRNPHSSTSWVSFTKLGVFPHPFFLFSMEPIQGFFNQVWGVPYWLVNRQSQSWLCQTLIVCSWLKPLGFSCSARTVPRQQRSSFPRTLRLSSPHPSNTSNLLCALKILKPQRGFSVLLLPLPFRFPSRTFSCLASLLFSVAFDVFIER